MATTQSELPGEGMVDEAAVSVTTDDAVRRLLLSRIDGAYRLATFILRDRLAAEDAVQEAALLAWDRRRRLRDGQAFDGWFTRILVNVCRDELRRRARRPRVMTIDPSAGEINKSDPAHRRIRSSGPRAGNVIWHLSLQRRARLMEGAVPR